MSARDFEMVRLGLSQQDPEAFASLARIEKRQTELVAALEACVRAFDGGHLPGNTREGDLADALSRAVLAKAQGEQS